MRHINGVYLLTLLLVGCIMYADDLILILETVNGPC